MVEFIFLACLLLNIENNGIYDQTNKKSQENSLYYKGVEIPRWPRAYSASGTIKVPYAEITEPFIAWYDEGAGASRVDYYSGTVKTYQLSKEGDYGTYYKVEPVLTSEKCFKIMGTAKKKVVPQSVLPNMTGFSYQGEEEILGVMAEKWQQVSITDAVFTMYLYWKLTADGSAKTIVPVRYETLGSDHYYLDFTDFSAINPAPDTFQIKNEDSCRILEEYELNGLEEQLIYSFNPIKEFVDNVTDHLENAWTNFKLEFNKKYDDDEENERKNIFRQNLRLIASTNRANLSYSLGVNHMADYTPDEHNLLTSCIRDDGYFDDGDGVFDDEDSHNDTSVSGYLPNSWDWRNRGAVTPVKDQWQCGACYCFSATGAIEGAHFIKTKQLLTLSEQVLMDCSWDDGNKGCNGGHMEYAFKWTLENKGIPLTTAYGPYMGRQNYCRVRKGMVSVKISGYKRVKRRCPVCIKKALIRYGPIAVTVHVNKHFTFYKRGVFVDKKCSKTKMNHALLIVGYGKMRGLDYWLAKNSWSNRWGSGGYILIEMNTNTCGIMRDPLAVLG